MIQEFIYRGLFIRTECKYFQVSYGGITKFSEDIPGSTATLYVSDRTMTAGQISDITGLKLVGSGDMIVEPMSKPMKISTGSITINGLRINKLTLENHTINIVIVGDSESRVVQSYGRTVIVVSTEDYKNPDFIKFIFFSGSLLYLRPIGKIPDDWEIRNFPKIIIDSSTKVLNSSSETVFYLRRRYDDYVIREIDYQNQLILEVRKILEDYGIQLVRINKETTLSKTSYVQYQFIQTPVKASHSFSGDLSQNVLSFHQPVEFSLHTNDTVLYHDFKNKFLNVNLLSNLTEIKATSRYGTRYTAAIKWGDLTEEFNQVYQPDDNSNFAYQCQFRCDMFFYEIQDTRYKFLEDIIYELNQEKQKI